MTNKTKNPILPSCALKQKKRSPKPIHIPYNCRLLELYKYICESFQDYSWIQDFDADFLWKVNLKILNSAGNNSFSDFVTIYLMVFDH